LDEPKKRPPLRSVLREARDLIAQHRARLLLGLVLMLISRLAGIVLPATSKFLIDDVIGKGRTDLLVPLAIAGGAATLVQAVLGFLLAMILGVAAQRAINDMRKSVQAHVTRLPVRFFDGTKTGALISRIMTDAEGIRNLVGNGLVELVGGLITATLALGVLFYLNANLTFVLLLVLAVSGVGMVWLFKYLRPIFRERGKINAEVTGRLTESLGGIRVVKAYVAEEHEQGVFRAGVDRYFENIRKSIRGVAGAGAGSTVVLGVVGVIVFLLGGRAILDGEMTLGDLTAYIFFAGLLAAPVVQMASIGTQITDAFAGMDRIRELRSNATEDAEDASRAPCPTVEGHIRFEGVWFQYDAGRPVLKGIDLDAPPGTTTALVGSSGSGKSTLTGLVMGFHRPTQGRVLVDGNDLSTLRLHDYREHLGVVLQDDFLFDGTIADNVSFSRPGASRGAIEEVCRVAHADGFIRAFEKGYDSIVGERGIKVSGGQRQRLTIARALLANPRILILDEATSSLDSESEAQIQAGLRTLRKSRTTFVIAHRLSTIRSADQILVLEGGVIVERGTHAALYALNGRYRELHDRQYAFEHERFVNPGEELA